MGLLYRRHQVTRLRAQRLRTVALATASLILLLAGPLGALQEATTAPAEPPEASLLPSRLRVATSGDYPPFSQRTRGTPFFAPALSPYEGFDIAVAQAFAHAHKRRLTWVPMRWPQLLEQLHSGDVDLVMSGVTIRPERSIAGNFSLAVAHSGAVLLVPPSSAAKEEADFNDPRIRIAVNAGGHLEKVARRFFPDASLVPLPDNAAVLMALIDRSADAVMTDTVEAPRWQKGTEAKLLGPLTHDRKGYLVRPDLPQLSLALDSWILEAEADGTLPELRRVWLNVTPQDAASAASAASSILMDALAAAIDERFALMPFVASAKFAVGREIEDTTREQVVLTAAVEAVNEASAREGLTTHDEQQVRNLFQSLINGAKDIQAQSLEHHDDSSAQIVTFSLESEIRPALLRIGARIAMLISRLRQPLNPDECHEALDGLLLGRGLSQSRIDEITNALVGLTLPQESSTQELPQTETH